MGLVNSTLEACLLRDATVRAMLGGGSQTIAPPHLHIVWLGLPEDLWTNPGMSLLLV